MEWRPILSGEAEARAREAISDIAAALRADRSIESQHPSFAAGKPGIAVFFHYLALAGLAPEGDDASARLLAEALAAAPGARLGSGLFGGLAGPGWAVAHTQPSEVGSQVLDQVDAGLLRLAGDVPWTGSFDLVGGLVGYGVYALERLPEPPARSLLEEVVHRLSDVAVRDPEGCRWVNPSEEGGIDRVNLGLAHGVPGVVSLLVSAYEAGVARDTARELASDAIGWLLGQRLDRSGGAVFPYWVGAGREPKAARTAWCYGDPGVAIALLRAGRALDRADWEEEAVAIAEAATQRPATETSIVDCGLCHGAAGVGHIFNRLYQSTGRPVFLEAAERWLGWTLNRRDEPRGLAGFLTLEADNDLVVGRRPVPGFLTGVAGIGLALLAAATPVRPGWDRVLLLSGRPSAVA